MADCRFPKALRVRRHADYRLIQQRGRRFSTAHFAVLLHPRVIAQPADGAATETARFGITVSRKVGNAVARNRIKRLLREVFRQNQGLFPPQVDIVVIVKRAERELTYEQVCLELQAAERGLRRRAQEALRTRAEGR